MRGAEAVITIDGDRVTKDRVPKRYRYPELDQRLRKERTRREANILKKLGTPRLIETDRASRIVMAHIDGPIVRDVLDEDPTLGKAIGKAVEKLHEKDIIHGDLTTSNMILASNIVLIDFGLSFFSPHAEDKAVDLHVLKQALESKHHAVFEEVFQSFLENYNPPERQKILERLHAVEKRGRNKK